MKNPTSYYIVVRASHIAEQTHLEPAHFPRIFGTFKQARAVAYKLAEESGESFVVFKSVFEAKTARVVGNYFEGCEDA